jgi:hypothetical protein
VLQTIKQFLQELSGDATRSPAVRGEAQAACLLLAGELTGHTSSEATESSEVEEEDEDGGSERPAKRSRV